MRISTIAERPGRIEAIDLARGLALLAMASYHLAFDLEMLRFIPAGTALSTPWRLYAHGIASSFLFLVGVSLLLANGQRPFAKINWAGFAKRFAMITGCAVIVSLATWFQDAETYVFFGILQHIAFATIAGLCFVWLPWWLTSIGAAIVIFAKPLLVSSLFDPPLLWWTGLETVLPRSVDYVPVFPWFGAVLIGIAAARFGLAHGFFDWLKQFGCEQKPWRLIKLFGRHSLLFYMLHQPILFGLVYLAALLMARQG